MKPRHFHWMAALLAALSFAATVSGCAGPDATTPFCSNPSRLATEAGAHKHVIVVVADVANAPAPELTASMGQVLDDVLTAGGRVDLVSTAGNGSVCRAEDLNLKRFKDTTSEAGKDSVVRKNRLRITQEMTRAPQTSGSDMYAALDLAAAQFKSAGAAERHLLVIGSGLNDHGLLDMTAPGALGVEPAESVAALKAKGSLIELDGVNTVVAGLGYTADPQADLPIHVRRVVVSTYQGILEAAGAEVTIDPGPASGPSVELNGTSVKPVEIPSDPVPTPKPCEPTVLVYDQTSALRFVADQATFVDADAAEQALQPLVDWLAADPTRTVSILGTTARFGPKANQVALGRQRGQMVKQLLLARGVQTKQVTSVDSFGSYFEGYVVDSDANGNAIPAAAARNRSVRLTLTAKCT